MGNKAPRLTRFVIGDHVGRHTRGRSQSLPRVFLAPQCRIIGTLLPAYSSFCRARRRGVRKGFHSVKQQRDAATRTEQFMVLPKAHPRGKKNPAPACCAAAVPERRARCRARNRCANRSGQDPAS